MPDPKNDERRDFLKRAYLPVPDRQRTGLITYGAKDPNRRTDPTTN